MRFIKDILFFEIQTTGADIEKDQIIQLSAVLLDKDNLLEKDYFNSYVRLSYMDSVCMQHAKILNVTLETIKKSPKTYDVLKKFHSQFYPTSVLLAAHSSANLLFLKNTYKKALLNFDYDYHMLQLWSIGYIYTLSRGLKKMPTLDTFISYFKLPYPSLFNALDKVRTEAEILRKITAGY